MTDNDKAPNELSESDIEQPTGDEDIVNFSDRVIAFLILILPFSWFIDKAQEVLLEKTSQFISHMAVLVGLIAFLILVGWLSRRVHEFRKKM